MVLLVTFWNGCFCCKVNSWYEVINSWTQWKIFTDPCISVLDLKSSSLHVQVAISSRHCLECHSIHPKILESDRFRVSLPSEIQLCTRWTNWKVNIGESPSLNLELCAFVAIQKYCIYWEQTLKPFLEGACHWNLPRVEIDEATTDLPNHLCWDYVEEGRWK